MSNKTVLVVGGAGYIGAHVNKLLCQRGYRTIVLDNLSRGYREAVRDGHFIHGDIGNKSDLERVFSTTTIDVVMHFAALINVAESVTEPMRYYDNNVAATMNLLNAIVAHNVKKFIFSSSAAVYGLAKEKPIKETHACNPINPYGQTKLIVEKILQDYTHAYGIKTCSLRYFNAAGGDPEGVIKNYRKDHIHLIPIVLRKMQTSSGTITINGTDFSTPDGTCIRDYVHVVDLAKAHINAMEMLDSGTCAPCYNLGNGKGYSVREVIDAAEKVTGRKVATIEGKRREGDPPILLADSTKARKELGWKPRYPQLETIIDHAWKAMHF